MAPEEGKRYTTHFGVVELNMDEFLRTKKEFKNLNHSEIVRKAFRRMALEEGFSLNPDDTRLTMLEKDNGERATGWEFKRQMKFWRINNLPTHAQMALLTDDPAKTRKELLLERRLAKEPDLASTGTSLRVKEDDKK